MSIVESVKAVMWARKTTLAFENYRDAPAPERDHVVRGDGQVPHCDHTAAGVMVRVLQRILALTAAIWHNDHTGQPVKRSLVAYDPELFA
jgi:hypothetical protein